MVLFMDISYVHANIGIYIYIMFYYDQNLARMASGGL